MIANRTSAYLAVGRAVTPGLLMRGTCASTGEQVQDVCESGFDQRVGPIINMHKHPTLRKLQATLRPGGCFRRYVCICVHEGISPDGPFEKHSRRAPRTCFYAYIRVYLLVVRSQNK